MFIQTNNFGDIEIEDSKIIEFPESLPGFPGLTKFALIHEQSEEKNSKKVFCFLQSMEDGNVAFTLMDVFQLISDYEPIFGDDDLEDIGGFSPENCLIYNIVVVPEDLNNMRVNLKAPVVINSDTNKGKQTILDGDYELRYYIYSKLKEKAGEK